MLRDFLEIGMANTPGDADRLTGKGTGVPSTGVNRAIAAQTEKSLETRAILYGGSIYRTICP